MNTDKELTLDDLPPLGENERNWWNEHNDEYYHYLYRIDNTENGMFYYGIHSQRKDSGRLPENDGYMGSGIHLRRAERKYGINKFTKTIIKTFSTRDEARLEEMRVVNESLVEDSNCYNMTIGGGVVSSTTGFSTYKNKDNYTDTRQLSVNDPLVTSGQFISINAETNKGFCIYKNIDNPNDIRKLHFQDPLVISKQFVSLNCGKGIYINKDNPNDRKWLSVDDPLVISGNFISLSSYFKKGKITYRNIKTGERKMFVRDDSSIDKNLWKPNFLFAGDLGLITIDLLVKLYKELNNSWDAVSKYIGTSTRTLGVIRKYYREQGYDIK